MGRVGFFIILGIIFLFLDVYTYFGLKSIVSPRFSKAFMMLYFGVSAFIYYALITLFLFYTSDQPQLKTEFLNFLTGFVMTMFFTKLLFGTILMIQDGGRALLGGINYLKSLFSEDESTVASFIPERRKFITTTGTFMAGIPFFSMLYGITKGKYQYTVQKLVLKFENLPKAFDGFRLVEISDIHAEVSETDLKRKLGVSSGAIDLVAGGPPCQGFSINAPIRTLDDERNHLFKDFLRVVSSIKPKAVLIENVPGIVSLGRGTVVEQIYKELQAMGYTVKHRILFAGHYGVPQMRFRTVFIGIRNFKREISFPEPLYNAKAITNFSGARELCLSVPALFAQELEPHTTVWDAMSDFGLWMVEPGGRVSPERVTNHSRVEHPDDWLKPIPPEVLDEDAERAREKLDAWLLKLRTPAADARKTAQITT